MMGYGLKLGSIGGVEVHLDWSLLIIFVLISVGLGSGLLPQWHPDWSGSVTWLTAVAAAIAFLATILLHELSHAWVGRLQGVDIRRITLFVFGGIAQIEQEPHHWRAELWIALIGPVTSVLIGVAAITLGYMIAGDIDLEAGNIEATVRALDPLATLLFWLGPVNIMLAIFNLVPGFPLDGGRVLRAALWGFFGDLRRATLWASNCGRLFGALLIASGVAMILGFTVPVFGTGLVGGLWIALIGWFLSNAAIMSFRQQLARETLENVRVEEVMQTRIASVSPDLSVEDLIEQYLLRSEQRAFPVVNGEELVGLVTMDDIRDVERARWPSTRVDAVMTPFSELEILAPDEPALDAMMRVRRPGPSVIPVVDAGQRRVLGLLIPQDLAKWLSLYGNVSEPATLRGAIDEVRD